jgi:REP element-mobilizing transposase RayT
MSFQRKNNHWRKRLRYKNYDYSSTGAYYVTLCTLHGENLLVIPELRAIAKREWEALPTRYSAVTLDTYVLMQDHMHGLLWIDGRVKDAPTLFSIMQAYKSITTTRWIQHLRETQQERCGLLWQTSYHDEIIRNEQHLNNTRQYILNNPIVANIDPETGLPNP